MANTHHGIRSDSAAKAPFLTSRHELSSGNDISLGYLSNFFFPNGVKVPGTVRIFSVACDVNIAGTGTGKYVGFQILSPTPFKITHFGKSLSGITTTTKHVLLSEIGTDILDLAAQTPVVGNTSLGRLFGPIEIEILKNEAGLSANLFISPNIVSGDAITAYTIHAKFTPY